MKSQLDLEQLGRNEVELKANLYFHIGNPIKRWKIERVIPIKLILQVIKTFSLIAQVKYNCSEVHNQFLERFILTLNMNSYGTLPAVYRSLPNNLFFLRHILIISTMKGPIAIGSIAIGSIAIGPCVKVAIAVHAWVTIL